MKTCYRSLVCTALASAMLVLSCTPKMDYLRESSWFKGKHLRKSILVLIPAIVHDENLEIPHIDPFLGTLLRRHFEKVVVVDAVAAINALEKRGKDEFLQSFFSDFVSSEILDKDLFLDFAVIWQQDLNASYALLPEIVHVERYQNQTSSSQPIETGGQTVTEKRTSGIKVAMRLSVLRISDGELAWLGEGTNRKERLSCSKTIVLASEEKRKGFMDSLIEDVVEGLLPSSSEDDVHPETATHPSYPSLDEAVENTFVGILKNLSKGASPKLIGPVSFSDALSCS